MSTSPTPPDGAAVAHVDGPSPAAGSGTGPGAESRELRDRRTSDRRGAERRGTPRAAAAAAVPDRVLEAIATKPWAISEDGLARVLAVASRATLHPEALESRSGRALDNTRTATVRDGVATIPVMGPLVQRADLFTRISGATSYDTLSTDFHAALDDPSVRAILFDVDSPGGEAHGAGELANLVADARGRKALAAYVGGEGCSAAYWLAAACDEIVASPTALVGCLGVRMSMQDTSAADAKKGVSQLEFVSSLTPLKGLDPRTDAGKVRVQGIVDDMAAVFLGDVGRMRGLVGDGDVAAGLTPAHLSAIAAQTGAGEVFVGQRALAQGLADRLGSYEGLHAELARGGTARRRPLPRVTGSILRRGVVAPADPTPGAPAPGAPAPGAASAAATGLSSTLEPSMATRAPAAGSADRTATTTTTTTTEPATTEPETTTAEPAVADEGTAGVDAALATRLRAEGATAERGRITGILGYANRAGMPVLRACIDDASCSPDAAAARILGAETSAGAAHLQQLAGDEAALRANGQAPKTQVEGTAVPAAGAEPMGARIARTLAKHAPNKLAASARPPAARA